MRLWRCNNGYKEDNKIVHRVELAWRARTSKGRLYLVRAANKAKNATAGHE
jgi:hypothetical protein